MADCHTMRCTALMCHAACFYKPCYEEGPAHVVYFGKEAPACAHVTVKHCPVGACCKWSATWHHACNVPCCREDEDKFLPARSIPCSLVHRSALSSPYVSTCFARKVATH